MGELCSGSNMREHDDVIFISLKFHQNVLKNILLVPCTFEANVWCSAAVILAAYLMGQKYRIIIMNKKKELKDENKK